MLYAVIADIHGNYPALRAVLEDAREAGAQQYLLLGDFLTDWPFTREVLETPCLCQGTGSGTWIFYTRRTATGSNSRRCS